MNKCFIEILKLRTFEKSPPSEAQWSWIAWQLCYGEMLFQTILGVRGKMIMKSSGGIGSSLDSQSRKFWKRYYQDGLSRQHKIQFSMLSCLKRESALNWSLLVLKILHLYLNNYTVFEVETRRQYVFHAVRKVMMVWKDWQNKK